MSILKAKLEIKKNNIASEYGAVASDKDKAIRNKIINDFRLGDIVMNKPRMEWNDLSTLQRSQVDRMAFNTYQPNNGNPIAGDIVNSWRSNAMRPIVRNKCVSILAHTASKMLYPDIEARDSDNNGHVESAEVMSDLVTFACDESNYNYNAIKASASALFSPASLVFTEYAKVERTVKKNGVAVQIEDEEYTGFSDIVVPVEELYIENFYEHNIQKQNFLVWRRIPSYLSAQSKYQHYPNWKYVKPGIQLIYNDANSTFYEFYDQELRGELVEEICYWNRSLDLMIIMVNGVVLTDSDNPNPREDKKYPFAKFGYQLMDEGRCFYYKSLAFCLQQDANIINTLYPMIIDGSYMAMFPSLQNRGGESIGQNVNVPGTIINLSSPDSSLSPIFTGANLSAGITTLQTVELSLSDTSNTNINSSSRVAKTASESLIVKQEAEVIMDLFIQMLADFVKQYQTLRVNDILQYMTVAQASTLTSDKLLYRSFVIPSKSGSNDLPKKIAMDGSMPKELSEMETFVMSAELAKKKEMTLIKVNPVLFRELQYTVRATPDSISPQSEAVERSLLLEEYDRLIGNPRADQDAALRLLLESYPKTRKDVDKYVMVEDPQMGAGGGMQMPTGGDPFNPNPLAHSVMSQLAQAPSRNLPFGKSMLQ